MRRDVMTTGDWIKYFVKMLIPVYNIYFFIICVTGNEKVNESERNYVLASLAYSFIVSAISGVLVAFMTLIGVSLVGHLPVDEGGDVEIGYDEISDAFTGEYQEKTTEWMITTEEDDWTITTEEDTSLTSTSHTLDYDGGAYRYDDELVFSSSIGLYISNNTDSIVGISADDGTTPIDLMLQEYSGFSASDFIDTEEYLLSDSGAYYSISPLSDTISLYNVEGFDDTDTSDYSFASIFVNGVGSCYEVDIIFDNSEYNKVMEIINSIAVD